VARARSRSALGTRHRVRHPGTGRFAPAGTVTARRTSGSRATNARSRRGTSSPAPAASTG